jgi:hypothetical protein
LKPKYNRCLSCARLIVASELPMKYAQLNGPPIPYYKYEPQSELGNSSSKLFCERAIAIDSLDTVQLTNKRSSILNRWGNP